MKVRVPKVAVATAGLFVLGVASAGSPPLTSPQTQSFDVRLTISPECAVDVIPDLDFTPGTGVGYLTSDLTAETTISVGCTKGTVATVKLSDGLNFLGTRRMSNGAAFVAYDLFTDNTYTTVWNASNTRDATGTGAVTGASPAFDQALTVYGKVPAQNTGSTGLYTDTITATVEF